MSVPDPNISSSILGNDDSGDDSSRGEYVQVERKSKILPFNPKKTVWRIWSKQFLQRANERGYREILLGEKTVVSDAESKTLKKTDGKYKTYLLNNKAYGDLMMCFMDDVNFGIIEDAVTDVLEMGCAATAWKNLCNKHDPSTAATLVQLKKEFATLKLKKVSVDPEEWITELEVLRRRMRACGHILTDDDVIIHIISNMPRDYDAICDQLENELGDEDLKKKITIQEIKNRLRNKFNKLKLRVKSINDADETSNEKLMSIKSYKKAFKGKCFNCGKYGHRLSECTEKKKGEDSPAPKPENGDKQDKFCTFCKKKGHTENYCWKKKKQNEQIKTGKTNETVNAIMVSNFSQIRPGTEKSEKIMMITSNKLSIHSEDEYKNFFIADSGASAHFVKSLEGVREIEEYSQPVDLPNGAGVMKITHAGYFHGTCIHQNGTKAYIKLRVMYIPGLTENIISINEALKNGWSLSNENEIICLKHEDSIMRFDRRDDCGNGHVMCCKIIPTLIIKNDKLNNIKNGKNWDINDLHVALGHPSEDKTRLTAKALGVEVYGEFAICQDCHMGKARRKKISKIPTVKTSIPFENLNIDMEPIKSTTNGVNKNWVLVTDRCTDMKWSFFMKKKSDQVKIIYEWLLKMRDNNFHCKTLRLDNSGENRKLEYKLHTSGFGDIRFEYTSPRTPEQNGKVERGFATILGRTRSMMNSAGLTSNMRSRL
jgi:hypothetical protein